MEDIFSLNVLDDFVFSSINESPEYKEFCSDLNELGIMLDTELYLEAIVDNKASFFKTVGDVWRNTKDTTKQAHGVYKDVTDAGGGFMKATYDAVMGALAIVARIIKFILGMVSKIPQGIASLLKMIGNIPTAIRNKIRGNISLNFTAEDLGKINTELIPEIEAFISLAKEMADGDVWSSVFGSKNVKELTTNAVNYFFGGTDTAIFKKMKKAYRKINIQVEKTTIEMRDQNLVDIYFGAKVFTDSSGKETTYYNGLKKISASIDKLKPKLEPIGKLLGDKINRSQINQSFAHLPDAVKGDIRESVVMTSKVVKSIGDILKCINQDMTTISENVNKVNDRKAKAKK